MADSEEEAYSAVFASLRHPIRRRILRILSNGPESFSDLQKAIMIESSHLTYHLEGLGSLLLKTGGGKYSLSSLGQAAVSTMNKVEEPPKSPLHAQLPSKSWKILTASMLIGFILLSTFFCLEYQRLNELSSRYAILREEHELLQEALREALHLGDAILTYGHTVNSTVATAFLQNMTIELSWLPEPNGTVAYFENRTATNMTTPLGHDIDVYSVHTLTDNSTLEIRISFLNEEPRALLSASIWEDIFEKSTCDPPAGDFALSRSVTVLNCTEPSGDLSVTSSGYVTAIYAVIWETKVTNNMTFSVPLSSRGHYLIQVEAPSVWNATELREINYAITLQVKRQRNQAPFFAEDRAERASNWISFDFLPYGSSYWRPNGGDP